MSQVATGAKLELRIGTVIVVYANNATYSYQIEVERIKVVDEETVSEFAEIGTTVEFTASMFRVAFEAAITNGWMPKLEKLLQQPELTATIKDKISGATLLNITGVKCVGRSGSIDARGVWVETLNFVGRVFRDEES